MFVEPLFSLSVPLLLHRFSSLLRLPPPAVESAESVSRAETADKRNGRCCEVTAVVFHFTAAAVGGDVVAYIADEDGSSLYSLHPESALREVQ